MVFYLCRRQVNKQTCRQVDRTTCRQDDRQLCEKFVRNKYAPLRCLRILHIRGDYLCGRLVDGLTGRQEDRPTGSQEGIMNVLGHIKMLKEIPKMILSTLIPGKVRYTMLQLFSNINLTRIQCVQTFFPDSMKFMQVNLCYFLS